MPPKVYYSPYKDTPLHDESIFTHIFRTRFSDHPEDGLAYIDADTGHNFTRRDVKRLALELAWGVRNDLRAKPGDTAMIFSPNSVSWIVMFHSLVAAGVKVSPANAAYTANELKHQYTNSGSHFIFTHPDLVKTVKRMFDDAGISPEDAAQRTILITSLFGSARREQDGLQTIDSLVGRGALSKEHRLSGKAENAFLCYSSGTTGKPKGVESTHVNMTITCDSMLEVLPLQSGKDVVLGFLPFSHIYGLFAIVCWPLIAGLTAVVMPRFDPVKFCANIERYKVSMAPVAPPVLVILNRHPAVEKHDLRSLSLITVGAAPVSENLAKSVRERLAKLGTRVSILQGLGLTETITAMMDDAEHSETAFGSVGRLLPNVEARVVEGEKDAAEGEIGELWLRGPNVFKGYWNNLEATESSMRKDGFFMTGDLVTCDKNGYFQVVGRRKELIKYKGFQGMKTSILPAALAETQTVPPSELEDVLLKHPKIADVGVVGVHSDAEATELPRAYIVSQGEFAGSHLADEIQAWLKPQVARHKLLRGGIVIIDQIPKSPSGKILRLELQKLSKDNSLKVLGLPLANARL